ncbi:MAG: energy-coupled thiamine transporter ThiT [Cellulosilyticaceae bacterium]
MNYFLEIIEQMPIAFWTFVTVGILLFFYYRIYHSKKEKQTRHTIDKLTLSGMCISLSFILSYISLFKLPQGGSITLASMLPILLFSFFAGPRFGLIAGATFGVLQFLQGGVAIHWFALLLDYPLSFMCLGLSGIVSKKIIPISYRFCIGVTIAVFGRFVMSVLSGAIFYSMYAPEGMNAWLYSILYNGSYLLPELIITLVIGVIILKSPVSKVLKLTFKK